MRRCLAHVVTPRPAFISTIRHKMEGLISAYASTTPATINESRAIHTLDSAADYLLTYYSPAANIVRFVRAWLLPAAQD